MTAGRPAGGPSLGVARLAEETRERFVREIAARVPVERMVELFLFAAIRQGSVESGVAVLAAHRDVVEPADDPTLELSAPPPDAPPVDAPPSEPSPMDATQPDARSLDAPPLLRDDRGDPTEAAAADPPVADALAAKANDTSPRDEPDPSEPSEPSATELAPAAASPPPEAADATLPPALPAGPGRHTVFVARYRLVVKGPERGRWEVEVREEADAPLDTVALVVRGVQRRAGDEAEPLRLDAGAVARLLGRSANPAATPTG